MVTQSFDERRYSMRHISIYSVAAVALLAGCSTQRGPNLRPETNRWQEYQLNRIEQHIRMGMTPTQVIKMTGKPDYKSDTKWTWRCHEEPRSNFFKDLIVVFSDGKVSEYGVWEVIVD
jgi:hypothetical protein